MSTSPVFSASATQLAAGLDEVAQRIGGRFSRSEPCHRTMAYWQGLLSPVERQTGWQLAEQAGDALPYGVQHLLGRATGEADEVGDNRRFYVIEHLGVSNFLYQ